MDSAWRQGASGCSKHEDSSVCLKELVRRAVELKEPITFKVVPPSKFEVPKTLEKSTVKRQVYVDSMYKPGTLDRAVDVRSSVRNLLPEPEHKPPHQATGARPKTSQLLRTSRPRTSDGSKLMESQTEKAKMLPREERPARLPKHDVSVFGSRETFYRSIQTTPTKNDKSRESSTVNRALSPPCLYCKGNHAFKECPEFAKKPHDLKLKVIREAGRCFGCLALGHFSRSCESRIICSICSLDHPRILHRQTLEEMMEETIETLSWLEKL
ncbi:hypothetical protein NQD34_015670 [Periophthalmus magnuspinnatus]|nr:hypothetical protein NQD34_015670 [Periophthalmus magnuspinnatus]